MDKQKKKTLITVAVALVIVLALNMVGGLKFELGDTGFTAGTAVWKNKTVEYFDIASIKLEDNVDFGKRIGGYGSAKLSIGNFKNSEFGSYTIYAFTQCRTVVVMKLNDGSILVIGGESREASEELYKTIKGKCGI